MTEQNDIDNSKSFEKIISEIRERNLSYCGPPKLENIADSIAQVKKNNVSGIYLEAGVALGGSGILIAKLKPRQLRLELYDVFGMIPAPGDDDESDAHDRYKEISAGTSKGLGQDTYYGYVENLLDEVKLNFSRFDLDPTQDNIRFIKGLYENSLFPDDDIAFAHVDCDWYDSVKICIERITPRISEMGIIIFDDYSSYAGCKRAVDEWLLANDEFEIIFHKRSLGVRKKNISPLTSSESEE